MLTYEQMQQLKLYANLQAGISEHPILKEAKRYEELLIKLRDHAVYCKICSDDKGK